MSEPTPLFFVVDITNLCRWGLPDKTSLLSRFELIRAEIAQRWPEAVTHHVADQSWRHDFRLGSADRTRVERLVSKQVIEQARVADVLCLNYARVYGGYVITNDMYRDHRDAYPDIIPSRLIGCDFVGTAQASIRASDGLSALKGEADPDELNAAERIRAERARSAASEIAKSTSGQAIHPDVSPGPASPAAAIEGGASK